MLQNVTVRHVRIVPVCRVREAQKYFGDASSRDRGDIFPACTVRLRWLAILRDDPKLAAVNVYWMQHAVSSFRNSPSEVLIVGSRKVDSVKREGLSVHAICRELV